MEQSVTCELAGLAPRAGLRPPHLAGLARTRPGGHRASSATSMPIESSIEEAYTAARVDVSPSGRVTLGQVPFRCRRKLSRFHRGCGSGRPGK
jgi:hypothetical protein